MKAKSFTFTWNGQEQDLTLAEWERLTGIKEVTLRYRLKAGWPKSQVLLTDAKARLARPKGRPAKRYRLIWNGEEQEHSIQEWSRTTGIPANTMYARLLRGWFADDALLSPLKSAQRQAGKAYRLTWQGKTEEHTVPEWSRITGINKRTMYYRLSRYGYEEGMLLSPPKNRGCHAVKLADEVTCLRERSSKKDVNTTVVEEVIEEYCRPEGL